MFMLEDLSKPADKVTVPEGWSPSIEFDATGGIAFFLPSSTLVRASSNCLIV